MLNVDGNANPADGFTKHLAKNVFRMYMGRAYNLAASLFKISH